MSKKTWKIILISLGTLLLLGLALLFTGVIGRLAQPYRINTVIQEYAVDKNIFTPHKPTDTREQWGFQGDGQIEWTYKLTSAEVTRLLSNKPPIKCGDGSPCEIETSPTSEDEYCISASHKNVDRVVTLCVDSKLDEAHWTYSLY